MAAAGYCIVLINGNVWVCCWLLGQQSCVGTSTSTGKWCWMLEQELVIAIYYL